MHTSVASMGITGMILSVWDRKGLFPARGQNSSKKPCGGRGRNWKHRTSFAACSRTQVVVRGKWCEARKREAWRHGFIHSIGCLPVPDFFLMHERCNSDADQFCVEFGPGSGQGGI